MESINVKDLFYYDDNLGFCIYKDKNFNPLDYIYIIQHFDSHLRYSNISFETDIDIIYHFLQYHKKDYNIYILNKINMNIKEVLIFS